MQELGKICVLGGDGRTSAMAERLSELGYEVVVWGTDKTAQRITVAKTYEQAIQNACAVVLPIPAFDVDGYVFGSRAGLRMRELFYTVEGKIPVWGGRISPAAMGLGQEMGVRLYDYMTLEEVQLRNAIPSAEGAISLCMRELDITLHGAQVAVLGYGRVGRALASRLAALGADVCVAVRKKVDMTRISCDGYRPLLMTGEGLYALCDGYDVIFNTVPARIISEDLLTRLSKETLLIELASCPGGWSSEEAARLGHRVIYAPGLPAKYAPRSAGRLIAEVLYSYLADEEVGTP